MSIDAKSAALMWIIREYKSVTLNELFRLIVLEMEQYNHTIFQVLMEGIQPSIQTSIRHRIEFLDSQRNVNLWRITISHLLPSDIENTLRNLLEAELVVYQEKQEGKDFLHMPGSTVIQLSENLAKIQKALGFSLTEAMARGNNQIVEAEPIFGKPLSRQYSTWAQVFVAMPFSPELKPIYDDHILPAAKSLGLSCKRGDDFFSANNIIDEVWSAIYHSDICIAECTGRNPNVFYEIGVAHTLGRKVILIAQSMEDIPFDVKQLRVIQYDQTPQGLNTLKDFLQKTLQTELHLELAQSPENLNPEIDPRFRLNITSKSGTRIVILANSRVVVGRGENADIDLKSTEGVSRNHFALTWNKNLETFTLIDFGTSNGVYVNDMRVINHTLDLNVGDVIRVGPEIKIRFENLD